MCLPISFSRIRDELEIPLPKVPRDLQTLVVDCNMEFAHARTFPQEKQRIGIIMMNFFFES